jgi:hypothetical protein
MLPRQGGHINYVKAAMGMLKMPRFNPLSMTTENKGVVAFNLSFLFGRIDLLQAAVSDLTAWVETGKIAVPKVRSYALADVAHAHQALESGETTGKLVLRTAAPLANVLLPNSAALNPSIRLSLNSIGFAEECRRYPRQTARPVELHATGPS